MLGKGKLAELRAIAQTHKLATGAQTVPNSVVENAAARADRLLKVQLLQRHYPPLNEKNSS